MIEKYKHADVNLGNLIKRILYDPVYRARWSLTLSMIWSIIMLGYYLALGIVDSLGVNDSSTTKNVIWSWYFNLAFWYLIFVIFKVILCINLFRRLNNKTSIDFKKLAIIFLYINFVETLFIALTPVFFRSVFQNKLTRSLKIVTVIINTINLLLFIWTFVPVRNKKYLSANEIEFLRSRKYVSRMAGLFNILIIVIHTLLYFDVQNIRPQAVLGTYLAITLTFSIMSLVIAIKLTIRRRRLLNKK